MSKHTLAIGFHSKPAYPPPPLTSFADEAAGDGPIPPTVAPASVPAALGKASSRLLIRGGRVVEHTDAAAPLQQKHRLQILMAVKVGNTDAHSPFCW